MSSPSRAVGSNKRLLVPQLLTVFQRTLVFCGIFTFLIGFFRRVAPNENRHCSCLITHEACWNIQRCTRTRNYCFRVNLFAVGFFDTVSDMLSKTQLKIILMIKHLKYIFKFASTISLTSQS